MSKRILTLEDLVKFCFEHNVASFNAQDSGYVLSVKVPATFEEAAADDDHRGMMRLRYRLLLLGKNSNGSSISKEAADDAAATVKNRPILGAIHSFEDGTEDFSTHEIEISEDENGETVINYIEKQIGALSSDEPFYEHDDETGQDWLCAYGYIPEEYTSAADIIRRKNGTTTSVELAIEQMSFNAAEKVLNLDKFYLSGVTCLGRDPETGREIKPGMANARADIADFSDANNGVVNKIESGSPVSIKNSEKGGKAPMKFEELLEKYGKTAEDVTFEYEGLSDEDLEKAFAEAFEEAPAEPVAESFEENPEAGDPAPEAPEAFEEKYVRTYELSHDDVRTALYALLEPFAQADNTWYWINEVYDDHFVYSDRDGAQYWDQKYVKEDDNVAFSGEREERFAMLLSASEKAQIDSMRANYAEISEKLAKYEAEPAKMEVLGSEEYSQVAESEEFAALVNDHFDLSVDDVKAKADDILLSYAKSHALRFSDDEAAVGRKVFQAAPKKSGRYGDLFSRKGTK